MNPLNNIVKLAAAVLLAVSAFMASHAQANAATLESRSYQAIPGATMEEFTEPSPGQSHTHPFSATVTFDLEAEPPSLIATIYNAVLERSDPFMLTVHSDTSYRLANGSYRFDGHYIPDSQYFFSWTFSTDANGQLLWNGDAGWAGGHIWRLSVNNVPINPVAKLEIERAGSQITLSWAAADTGYILEQTAALQPLAWTRVDTTPTTIGNRLIVSVDIGSTAAFFRIREP